MPDKSGGLASDESPLLACALFAVSGQRWAVASVHTFRRAGHATNRSQHTTDSPIQDELLHLLLCS
jgi:hypothetical protein